MKHYLFLDVDGVLNIQSNSYTTAMQRQGLLEPHLVSRLNYLCEKTSLETLCEAELNIVVSSSWRHDMSALENEMRLAGFKYWERVIGKTSSNPNTTKRGEQIQHWLYEKHGLLPSGIDFSLYILDDEVHDIYGFFDKKHIYTVSCALGLTDDIVQKIISDLERNK